MRPAHPPGRAARAGHPPPGWRVVGLRAALLAAALLSAALVPPGCRPDPAPPPPPSATAASTPTPAADPAPAADPTPAADPAPSGADPQRPPPDPWARPLPPEPDPAAKALYREALARLARGDHAGARPLLDRIRADHPDSRFAARLDQAGGRAGGPLALLAAVIALLSAAP